MVHVDLVPRHPLLDLEVGVGELVSQVQRLALHQWTMPCSNIVYKRALLPFCVQGAKKTASKSVANWFHVSRPLFPCLGGWRCWENVRERCKLEGMAPLPKNNCSLHRDVRTSQVWLIRIPEVG